MSFSHAARAVSRSGMGVVATVSLVHALLFFALSRMPTPRPPTVETVLSIGLLPPVDTRRPQPPPPPPPVKPVARRSPAPMPVAPAPLAAASDAPTPTSVAVSPAPTFAAPAMVAPPRSVEPPLAPAPVPAPPRFDADYLDNPKPSYPGLSRRLGEQGKVVLRVRVDTSGLPLDVQLHSSSGFARLDTAALETVRRWKFVAARLGDEAVVASVLVPIAFSLKD